MSEHGRESDRASRKMARVAEEISKAPRSCAGSPSASSYSPLRAARGGSGAHRRQTRAPRQEGPGMRARPPTHGPLPTAEEIREWERRRDDRRKREAS